MESHSVAKHVVARVDVCEIIGYLTGIGHEKQVIISYMYQFLKMTYCASLVTFKLIKPREIVAKSAKTRPKL